MSSHPKTWKNAEQFASNIPIYFTLDEYGKSSNLESQSSNVDICLLLEGTYPFVPGGVSSWVHSLIEGLSEITFYLYVLLPDSEEKEFRYKIPSNVKALYIHILERPEYHRRVKFWSLKKIKNLKHIISFHRKIFHFRKEADFNLNLENIPETEQNFLSDENQIEADIASEFALLVRQFSKDNLSISSILLSKTVFNLLKQFYHLRREGVSFVDYFLNWKSLHSTIFTLLNAYLPDAKIYHSITTGYAGFLGARAQIQTKRPLMLTEHGIYNKERKIDISRSPWIYEEKRNVFRIHEDLEIFKELWINAFSMMSKICYSCASEIITLYTGNQRYQLEDGAAPEKLKIIPNGIDYSRLASLERIPQEKKIVGFVGRIVPIKDVKTLIRAIDQVVRHFPEIEVWMMGPTDENEEYFEECKQLIGFLNLEETIKFMGMVDLIDWYPKLDILALTSISEAQPLVILEAYALGIPVVATDVGGCHELIFGVKDRDQHLGQGGIITSMANPAVTASAILKLLQSPELAAEYGNNGKERVKQYYDLPQLYDTYRSLYHEYLS